MLTGALKMPFFEAPALAFSLTCSAAAGLLGSGSGVDAGGSASAAGDGDEATGGAAAGAGAGRTKRARAFSPPSTETLCVSVDPSAPLNFTVCAPASTDT